jgi:hypothetical protein
MAGSTVVSEHIARLFRWHEAMGAHPGEDEAMTRRLD